MIYSSLIETWKESLDLYKRTELKTFCLASLNTIKRSLGLIFSSFWWAILLACGMLFYIYSILFPPLIYMMYVCSLFSAVLFVRASTENKQTLDYCFHYLPHFFYLGFYIISLAYLSHLLFGTFVSMFTLFVAYNPAFHLTLFFFLDTKPTIYNFFASMGRGTKCIVFYLPFFMGFFVFTAAYMLVSYFVTSTICYSINPEFFLAKIYTSQSYVSYLREIGAAFFLDLTYLAFFSTIYLKIKHSNYKLFFKQ